MDDEPAARAEGGPGHDGESIVEVEHLGKVFPIRRGIVLRRTVAEVHAVDDVSLTLRRGRTLGLVGESGSGKSTLARMLVGVERPTSGTIRLDGADVTALIGGRGSRAERKALRRRVQMVFQDPYTSLNPRMSVGEIVAEPFRIHPDAVPAGGRDKAVRALLDLVGLDPSHVNRYPHQFSGGQRQRIGIARALAVKPEVLVCDEPVSALDVSVQGQVINLLEELQDELGLSYLFIAHDLAVVRHIADEVAVMYLGGIVEHGAAADVYDRPAHPYTRALMSAVPVPDPSARLASAEIVLEGDLPSPVDPPPGCRFHTRCWLAARLAAEGEPATDGVPTRCVAEAPVLTGETPAHVAACHFSSHMSRTDLGATVGARHHL